MLGSGQYAPAPLGRSLNKVSPELLSVGGLNLIDVSSWLGKRRRRNYRPANRPRERTDTGRCKKESNSHSADRHDRLHPGRCDQARSLGSVRHCECEVRHIMEIELKKKPHLSRIADLEKQEL